MQNVRHKGTMFAIEDAPGVVIQSLQDALDRLAACKFEGDADVLVLRRAHLCDDFFDLRTGLAGDVLQKFTNYNLRVAIVGDFSDVTSRALRDFIYECNQGDAVMFLGSEEEALERMG